MGSEVVFHEEPLNKSTNPEPRASAIRMFFGDVRATVGKSLRSNRVPAMTSFLFGVVLIAVYYGGGDATRPSFETLAEFRSEGGLLFSTVVTGLSGGLLPSVLQAALGLLPRPYTVNIVFNVVLWSALGCAVDRLYLFQAWLFGDGADPAIVVQKVLFDQFVWNPIILGPWLALTFRWRDYRFSLRRWREVVQLRALALAYCSMMITCWGTWIPGTSVVYSFPTDLQMPAFNIILLMYSSLLSLVSQGATRSSSRQLGDADEAGPSLQKGPTIAEAATKEEPALAA